MNNCDQLVTFDSDFKRIEEITRWAPEENDNE